MCCKEVNSSQHSRDHQSTCSQELREATACGMVTEGLSMQGLDLGLYTSVADAQLGLHACPLTIGARAVSGSVPCHWVPFPYLDLLVGSPRGRMCSGLAGTRCHRVGWYPRLRVGGGRVGWGRGLPFLGGKGEGIMEGGNCNGGAWWKVGSRAAIGI